jgi:uncharacterized protein (UPF0548 family)
LALWRFGSSWSDAKLRARLNELSRLEVNFDLPPEQMTTEHGWTVDGVDERIGVEPPGPPLENGFFASAKRALISYRFSDRRIVVGHFDAKAPLQGRNMLLEIKVFGLRFLNGVRVSTVRDETDGQRTSFGYRYDTLEGHIEQGFEWFLLSKRHETGEIRFRVQAHWRMGEFPNWWSRVGFLVVGARFRERWRRQAVARMQRLARRQHQQTRHFAQSRTVPV